MIEVVEFGELQDLLDTEDQLVVKFTAPALCRPCQQLAPHYETAASKSATTFVAVDVDRSDWAMLDYGIRGVPTVMLFRKGQYVKHLEGRTVIKLLSELDD